MINESNNQQSPRLLVVGPVQESGGMAEVARQTADPSLYPEWEIRVADTSRTTRPGRSIFQACRAHAVRFWKLVNRLVRFRPHVVHLHTCSYWTFFRSMPDILVCAASGSKVILHVHGGFFDRFVESSSFLTRWLIGWHLRRCDVVLVLGDVWRQKLASLIPGPEYRVLVNGVAVPDKETCRCSCRAEKVRFLFAGDLSEQKGVGDLLYAVSELPSPLRDQSVFVLAGGADSVEIHKWETLVSELGIQSSIQFAGHLSRDELENEYIRCDVVVLPSHGEGMPLSLLEAMAHMRPVVSTHVGAISEVVREGKDGFLIDSQDVEALAHALSRLITNDSLRQEMGKYARERIEGHYSEEEFSSRLEEIRNSLLPISQKGYPLGT